MKDFFGGQTDSGLGLAEFKRTVTSEDEAPRSEKLSPIQEALLPAIRPIIERHFLEMEARLTSLILSQGAMFQEQLERRVSERLANVTQESAAVSSSSYLQDSDIQVGDFYLSEVTNKLVAVKVTYCYPAGPDGRVSYRVIRGDTGRNIQTPRTCEELFPLDYAPPASRPSRIRPKSISEAPESVFQMNGRRIAEGE